MPVPFTTSWKVAPGADRSQLDPGAWVAPGTLPVVVAVVLDEAVVVIKLEASPESIVMPLGYEPASFVAKATAKAGISQAILKRGPIISMDDCASDRRSEGKYSCHGGILGSRSLLIYYSQQLRMKPYAAGYTLRHSISFVEDWKFGVIVRALVKGMPNPATYRPTTETMTVQP